MWAARDRQTHTQTAVMNIHFASATPQLKRNNKMMRKYLMHAQKLIGSQLILLENATDERNESKSKWVTAIH